MLLALASVPLEAVALEVGRPALELVLVLALVLASESASQVLEEVVLERQRKKTMDTWIPNDLRPLDRGHRSN